MAKSASQAAPPDLGRHLTLGLAEALGRAIVSGTHDDAPFPTEAQIAEHYRVSRSIAREAVKMLAAKGLIAQRPRHGTYLQPQSEWHLLDSDVLRWLLDRTTSPDLLRHFNELRLGIEPQAAALAATRRDPDGLAAIAAGLERMRRAEARQDDPLAADIAFHVAVLEASGNPFYRQFRPMIATTLGTSIRQTNRIAGRTASIADHAAVQSAIAAGDADGAAAAARRLILEVLALIESLPAGD